MNKLNILLIGRGPWGKRYEETIRDLPFINLTIAGTDWRQWLDVQYDGCIVACPPQHHVEVAQEMLERSIATMIEKPLALNRTELDALLPYSSVPILVNHLHLFSYQYQIIKEASKYNKIKRIISSGYSSGPHRNHSSLWDYGPHDISMILDLIAEEPTITTCHKRTTVTGELFDIGLTFPSATTISTVGNGGDVKVRSLAVEMEDKTFSYKNEDNISMPLTNAILAFTKAIQHHHDYRFGLALSIKTVELLEKLSLQCLDGI